MIVSDPPRPVKQITVIISVLPMSKLELGAGFETE